MMGYLIEKCYDTEEGTFPTPVKVFLSEENAGKYCDLLNETYKKLCIEHRDNTWWTRDKLINDSMQTLYKEFDGGYTSDHNLYFIVDEIEIEE